jgi:ferredoxin-NADP reductase
MPSLLVAHHRPGFYFRVLQEGEVGAGDDIAKIADGPEPITVANMDALLYLPGHSREQLQRALQIPALSEGWKSSFRAILNEKSTADLNEKSAAEAPQGNPGLANEEKAPAWPAFKQMRVAQISKESDSVTSFVLAPVDVQALPLFTPGQFIVVKLHVEPDKPAVLRSYSLSDLPATDHFRISVKSEPDGIGSSFLCNHARVGDVFEVSAPRGSFTLRLGENPVVLLSAGVGATPVMSMLHALAAEKSQRQIWWIYGARDHANHPFAKESRSLLQQLSGGRSYILYSRPAAPDRPQIDFDAAGHMDTALLERIGVPQTSDFYLCGPPSFLENMRDGLQNWGVPAENVHTEIFGTLETITPGMARVDHTPHVPQGLNGTGPPVSFARSGITVGWDPKYQSLLELAEACDVPVRWSCRSGVCHTCMTGLIGGSIHYEPEPLEKPAPGNVLVCCARPDSPVTLDL